MDSEWAPIVFLALLLGGVVSVLGDVLTFVALVTAATSLSMRYYSVLRGYSKKKIDQATAFGFFLGVVVSAVSYIADLLI